MIEIESLSAREILDSRGKPTVSAACAVAGGPRWAGGGQG